MNIENVRQDRVGGANFTELNSQGETFQRTLSRTFASQSNSRLPKMEFSGTLIPSQDAAMKKRYPYSLRTKTNKYRLQIGDSLSGFARALEGKEVVVRGPFDFDEFAIAAEELMPVRSHFQQHALVSMAG